MTKPDGQEARLLRVGNAPFGERVSAQAAQETRVDEGRGSNHPTKATMFPFPGLAGRVRHRQAPRAMPCRAITRRELARFVASLHD